MRKQHEMKLEEWSRYVENLPKTWRGYVENVRAENPYLADKSHSQTSQIQFLTITPCQKDGMNRRYLQNIHVKILKTEKHCDN